MRRAWVVVPLLAAVLWGCAPAPQVVPSGAPTTSSASPAPEKVQVTDATKGEVQAVLQAQLSALTGRDLKAYQATYDLERLALRRCKQEAFDSEGRSGVALAGARVAKVETYGDAYVRAWVDDPNGAGLARIYFRKVSGKWVQSEPTNTEIGAEKKVTADGIDIEYWAIDEDVIGALTKATLSVKDFILQNEMSDAKVTFAVRFYPTRGIASLQACNVVGFQVPTGLPDQPDPFIRILRYWFASDGAEVSAMSVSFIRHEGLHWAQEAFIPGIVARTGWWLAEGWPDYIGRSRTEAYKRETVCRFPTPTFRQLTDGPGATDPNFPPENAARYYAIANTMVEYLYAQFGPSAYRDLLLAYKELADPNQNLPAVLKVTPEQFHAGWIAFARKKYC